MDLSDFPPARSQEEAMLQLAQILNSQSMRGGGLSEQASRDVIDGLPKINEEKLIELGEKDSSCPICFNSYLAIISEEEMALAMDSPAHPIEELGVTKLNQPWQCGHMFCRRDITKWIREGRRSCPMCRRSLVESTPEQPQTTDQPAQEGQPIPPTEPYVPIELTPEQLELARQSVNVDLTSLNPDPHQSPDATPPTAEEMRRRFLESNPWLPARIFDGLTNGELQEEEPEINRNAFAMYS